eukprot:NODE_15842_length_1027_cov_4.774444.p1 GENE.NODE_15842_length_1027_cov_4.774444~~NODE_15842_length_1027_cov_4.774444.p1  ORF type:complete len:125 (+),score=33.62 NODE_15842_length_1027_cov_4.774444:145-519(+)
MAFCCKVPNLCEETGDVMAPISHSDDMPFDELPKPVMEAGSVYVVFASEDGAIEVRFTHQPLGVDFWRRVPIKVKLVKAGGQAEGLGVQSDWEVRSVNGQTLKGETFVEDFDVLRLLVELLPME